MTETIISSTSLYEAVPAGSHQVVVFAAYQLGLHATRGYPMFEYALAMEIPWIKVEDQPKLYWQPVYQPNSSNLMGQLFAVAGLPLPADSLFDPAPLVGVNAMAQFVHNHKGGRTFSDVCGFTRLPSHIKPVQPTIPADAPLPSWLQRKVDRRMDPQNAPPPPDYGIESGIVDRAPMMGEPELECRKL